MKEPYHNFLKKFINWKVNKIASKNLTNYSLVPDPKLQLAEKAASPMHPANKKPEQSKTSPITHPKS